MSCVVFRVFFFCREDPLPLLFAPRSYLDTINCSSPLTEFLGGNPLLPFPFHRLPASICPFPPPFFHFLHVLALKYLSSFSLPAAEPPPPPACTPSPLSSDGPPCPLILNWLSLQPFFPEFPLFGLGICKRPLAASFFLLQCSAIPTCLPSMTNVY